MSGERVRPARSFWRLAGKSPARADSRTKRHAKERFAEAGRFRLIAAATAPRKFAGRCPA